jgi:hypothetical protein
MGRAMMLKKPRKTFFVSAITDSLRLRSPTVSTAKKVEPVKPRTAFQLW